MHARYVYVCVYLCTTVRLLRVFIDTYLYVYMTLCSCIVLVVVALPFESVIIVRCCKYVHRADSFCESRHRSPFQRRKIGGQKAFSIRSRLVTPKANDRFLINELGGRAMFP